MKTVNRDFFYFDPTIKREFADFTNNEVFTADERREFLEHYSDFIKKYYNLSEESEKPITEEKAKQVCENVARPVTLPKVSKRIDIKEMTAELEDKKSACVGVNLYTKRAVEGDAIVSNRGEITDFYRPCESGGTLESLGTVTVPFSVGNYKNRDKILRLKKDFEAEAAAKAYLTIGSIDPGGRVYLDGKLIAETYGFERLKLDITETLKKQTKHSLVIEVDPRIPDVLYCRHRNTDSYIGRFCEDVTIDIINDIEITDPKVITLTAGRGKATASFSCKTSKPCRVKVYLAETWPCKGEEKLLGTYNSDGSMSASVNFDKINLWSTEDPVLYDVRFVALSEAGLPVDDTVVETGFRTVEQKNGAIYINGIKTTMKGTPKMQYLPSYHETDATHICLRDWQIVWQYMMLKAMGGNMIRLRILGYGTNDVRFARYADRLGVMLIWITRYTDSVAPMEWEGTWGAKEGYIRQISLRLNHPSIVIWEVSNELHPTFENIDRIHESYVSAVKAVDETRLICSISFRSYSYEFPNENILGFKLTQDDWEISQAYQALCISYAVRKFRILDCDGIFWCCLMSEANDAGYLKSLIDDYGYAKYGFYTVKEYCRTVTCLNDTNDTKRGLGFAVKPVLFAFPGDTRTVTASVIDENGNEIDSFVYKEIEVYDYITRLPEWKPKVETEGYYAVQFIVK